MNFAAGRGDTLATQQTNITTCGSGTLAATNKNGTPLVGTNQA
jgi:hypothetical protein